MDFAILSVQIMGLVSFLPISCIQIFWLKSYFIKSFIFLRPNKSASTNNTINNKTSNDNKSISPFCIYMPNYFWQSKTKSTMCISISVAKCDILRWVMVWIFWYQILFARTINSSWISHVGNLANFFLQNLVMSSIFNVDYHGKKENCIFKLSTEKWSKLWFFG